MYIKDLSKKFYKFLHFTPKPWEHHVNIYNLTSFCFQEENHLPLRCEEVEKDDEVKVRTKLENEMTEAMVRICHKCKKR